MVRYTVGMSGGSSRSLVVIDADKGTQPRRKVLNSRAPKKTTKPAVAKKAKAAPKKKATKRVVAKKKTAKKATTRTTTKPITKHELAGIKREPLGHLLLEQMLRESGFRGTVSTDKELLGAYSTDESIFAVTPQVVIQPKHQKDVETAVQVVARETKRFSSLSLTPRAAGTGLSGGSLTDSVVIDVKKHLHKISQPIHKGDGITITAEPGAMWRDVEKILKKHNVYIPSFPASKDICTVGGAVSNNAAGPDSLRYGHTASWVSSLNVTLHDGQTYTVSPLNYKEFQALTKKKTAYAVIAKAVYELVRKNEAAIKKARPKTKKNSAGYALWDVIDGTVADFKKGKAHFDLTQLIAGSQGTIGIITSITFKTEPIESETTLLAIPVFDLSAAGEVVETALQYNPINIEIFDGLSYDLALKNPNFFKDRIKGAEYYRVLLSMYTTYHIRYKRKVPEFTLLVTLDNEQVTQHGAENITTAIKAAGGSRARIVKNPIENEMLWQIRRASYSLSKFQDTNKRPAAFLEDMTVPPKNLAPFFTEIKKLLKKYNLIAAVHGHGGNGHFHFYPLLDFTKQGIGELVEKLSEEFFSTAIKYQGNICGEHNDGIIRTPHLSKMFNKKTLDLFKTLEHTFDPDDIFNPGKKVNPRFDIKDTLRKTN